MKLTWKFYGWENVFFEKKASLQYKRNLFSKSYKNNLYSLF